MAAESIKEISFKCWRPAGEHISPINGGLRCRPEGISTVTFKLGLGPCGRFVEAIESTIDYHGVTIKQVSYPEDYGHLRESWKRLNETNVNNMHLIVGYSVYVGQKSQAYGYDNPVVMTPTKEQHEANIKLAFEFHKKYMALHNQCEIKEFFYKLEDVRGRIVVIR